jgi:hypothetical protein
MPQQATAATRDPRRPAPQTIRRIRRHTNVSTLRVSLTIYAEPSRGYGAEATVRSHDTSCHTTTPERTATAAANAVIGEILQRFPNWMVRDRATREALEQQLIKSLRDTGAVRVAGELSVSCAPHNRRTCARGLRSLACRAVGEGANQTQAAAIGLLAELSEATGATEALMLEAVSRVIESPRLNETTT